MVKKILLFIPLVIFISCKSILAQNKAIAKIEITPKVFYYNTGEIKSVGNLRKDYLPIYKARVGVWQEFYKNSKLKASGEYKTSSYINCCFAGPCDMYYSYRVGEWFFYFDSGNLMAKGVFKINKIKIDTSCEGGDIGFKSTIDFTWEFYNEIGQKITPSKKIIEKIEKESYIHLH